MLAVDTKPKMILSLTGVRGVGALWVVLYHVQSGAVSGGYLSADQTWGPLRYGWSGVDLFFLLSGFMLMHAHARDFQSLTRAGIWKFAVSRAFRIYPLSTATLLLIALLVVLYPAFAANFRSLEPGNLSLKSFVATLFLATRWFPLRGDWNQPTWSLSVELVGYALFPMLAFAFIRVRSCRWALLAVAFCIAAVIVKQVAGDALGINHMTLGSSLVRMAGYFTAGVGLKQLAHLATRHAVIRGMAALSVAAVVMIIMLSFVPRGGGLMPIAFALLIFALYFQQGIVDRALSSNLAVFLGKISFPLYLIHEMPIQAFNFYARAVDLAPQSYAAWGLLLVVLIFAAALVLHRTIERPAHKFARLLGEVDARNR
ncbi:acyltransferase family protein [Sphingomonas sp. CFBP 8764]|uniref:acyltransferase family protein n=1 Tax=Sphingomonas sp. CFBP 8764 TaxID=2775275 RepID=UPI00178047E8|nr:acyltransferase [Sphingomonas sp. CFBP 8764]MBD8549502.1 acyltransferase [Sphingomonas sp. CFBP 8764]